MGESGALGNTQGYSTHSENPSTDQISSSIATDETFGLASTRRFELSASVRKKQELIAERLFDCEYQFAMDRVLQCDQGWKRIDRSMARTFLVSAPTDM